MKYFWATRDKLGCCLWDSGLEPQWDMMSNIYVDGNLIKFNNKRVDMDEAEFENLFGITLKMNECKKVTIRLEEAK